jgi:hypothetical protein
MSKNETTVQAVSDEGLAMQNPMLRQNHKQPVPIRPHHGMCLAYFIGHGYSEGFTGHMQEMLNLFETDIEVRLTTDTDEICSACPNNEAGTCTDAARVKQFDQAVLDACRRENGDTLSFLTFAKEVQETIIQPGCRPQICGDCKWDNICRNKPSRWADL